MDKPIDWRGTAFEDIRAFPDDARRRMGRELRRVQGGDMPLDWKPFARIGPGVCEIRVASDDGAFRVMYMAKFEEAVYVLHCFQKSSRKTDNNDIEVAAKRYREVIKERSRRK